MSYEVPSLQLAEFMDLFAGDIHNYGVHQYNFNKAGKEDGKNATVTNKLLTVEQYKAHLIGKTGLGVIPINSDGEVKFGVIDIDVYDDNLAPYISALEANDFPLVPFKSKSGGLHLYLFLRQAAAAKPVIESLHKMVAMLSLDIYIKNKLNRLIEIFPKQAKIATGSTGSWINLPYYNVENTKQYAIVKGEQLSFDKALSHIKNKRKTLAEIQTFISEAPNADGPPCLQTIALLNNIDKGGGRNNYLFSFGVYLKKADPEFWEQKLFGVNEAMRTPLSKDELENTIVNSLRKRDYTYKCGDAPCVDHCRKAVCKTREFGIGKEGGYFSELEYGKLTQVKAFEPYYEWEVRLLGDEAFKLLRFQNEADIIGQDLFLRLCFRELHILPIKLRQSEWHKLINQALKELIVVNIHQDDDTTPVGMFRFIFTEFLTERAMAQTKDQILNKRVYHDEVKKCYYFKAADLSNYLFLTKNFKFFTPGQIHGLLRDFKCTATRISTESGRQFRVYTIKDEDMEKIGYMQSAVFAPEFVVDEEAF